MLQFGPIRHSAVGKELTLYYTIIHFNKPKEQPSENIVGKEENASNQQNYANSVNVGN